MQVELSIRDVARATGVAEDTLRAWERRYGFPMPRRLASGHRRYGPHDVEMIRRVLEERARGLSVPAAIANGLSAPEAVPSIFARLREQKRELAPQTVRKRELVAFCHAIEDESCSRAERGLLIGSFQRERFYRQSESRWIDLARGARLAFAMADFPRLRRPRGRPAEIPMSREHPLSREWALICYAPSHRVCMVAFEPPGGHAGPDRERELELIWSVDPVTVASAIEVVAEIVAGPAPQIAQAARACVEDDSVPPPAEQLRLATHVMSRTLAGLA